MFVLQAKDCLFYLNLNEREVLNNQNLFDIKASGDLDISKFSKIKDDLHNFPVWLGWRKSLR